MNANGRRWTRKHLRLSAFIGGSIVLMLPFNAREFALRWKDVAGISLEQLEATGEAQRAIIESAPANWFRGLVREVPAKELWTFLNPNPKTAFNPLRVELRQFVLRGFQAVAPMVKHPTVQGRLVSWLEAHRDVAHILLLLWSKNEVAWLETFSGDVSDEELKVILRERGVEAFALSAAFLGAQSLFERAHGWLENPETLREWLGAPEALPDEANESPEEGAAFWQGKARERELELKSVKEENRELPVLRERLRASAKEIERLKKEERQKSLAAQKRFELAQEAAAARLLELSKHDERETRRLNAAERARDELDSTVKVLRKQVRHLNQLLEAEQKKVAVLERELAAKTALPALEKLADTPTPPPPMAPEKPKAVRVVRPSPLDEVFRWMADGHEFRASARDVMRAIDRNDVDFAFRAQLALEGIAAKDAAQKTALLARLRGQDSYYVRVLTEPTQRALVDASNVVRATKSKFGKGELRNLFGVKAELRRLSFFPIEFIADASLRHNVDDINAYNEMVARGEIEVAPVGTEADETLVRRARSGGGYVVTNDTKFHFKVSPDLAPPSIPFRVFDGVVAIEEF